MNKHGKVPTVFRCNEKLCADPDSPRCHRNVFHIGNHWTKYRGHIWCWTRFMMQQRSWVFDDKLVK